VSYAAITLFVASQGMFIVLFRYRLSPETFGYTFVPYREYKVGIINQFCVHVCVKSRSKQELPRTL